MQDPKAKKVHFQHRALLLPTKTPCLRNTYNKDFLQYTLKHELTHVVNMFSAYRHNNIMSLKNTVGYDDNDL